MGERTTKSAIVSVLRGKLWLRSKERAATLKRDCYTCQHCGKKKSVAKGKECKVEVHHTMGIEWDEMVDAIQKELLCDPTHLETICKECHGNSV